jgi:hypothetical protein
MSSAAQREQARTIKNLSVCDKNGPDFPKYVRQAFLAFDDDGSGMLDMEEARHLLRAVLPAVEGTHFSEAMLEFRKFANHTGELNVSAFSDALTLVLPKYTGEDGPSEGLGTGGSIRRMQKSSPARRLAQGLAKIERSFRSMSPNRGAAYSPSALAQKAWAPRSKTKDGKEVVAPPAPVQVETSSQSPRSSPRGAQKRAPARVYPDPEGDEVSPRDDNGSGAGAPRQERHSSLVDTYKKDRLPAIDP